MKNKFVTIYEDLFEEYHILQAEFERFGYSPVFPSRRRERSRLIRLVIDACEDAMSTTGTRDYMRSDAKHFLLVNLHQMIASPIAMSGDFSKDDLHSILRHDAKAIIKSAQGNSPDREISGHAIISAVNKTWGELKSSKLEIWG